MLDGALVQFMYRFERRNLAGHRLAYLPAPDARQLHAGFDNSRDGHLKDVANRRAVPVPLRIDYDASEDPKAIFHGYLFWIVTGKPFRPTKQDCCSRRRTSSCTTTRGTSNHSNNLLARLDRRYR